MEYRVEFVPSRQAAVSSSNVVLGAMCCSDRRSYPPYQGPESFSYPAGNNVSSRYLDSEPMDPGAQRQKRREIVLSSLNVAIETSNLAKESCSIAPVKPVFSSLNVILTTVRVGFFLCRPR
jgi:hypothetical protein